MIRYTSRSLRNWGAAVAVVTNFLLTPGVCEAACGDYVQARGHTAGMLHSMSGQPASMDGSSVDGTSVDGADHSAPRPCQGPACSNRSFPPQAPAPSVVTSVERWAQARADVLPNSVCRYNRLAEPVDLVVDGFRSSILRPPR